MIQQVGVFIVDGGWAGVDAIDLVDELFLDDWTGSWLILHCECLKTRLNKCSIGSEKRPLAIAYMPSCACVTL